MAILSIMSKLSYGRSKLAFNLHRNITSNVPIRRTNQPLFHTCSSLSIIKHDPKSYPRWSGIQLEGRLSPFVCGVARRYYHIDLNWVLDYPKTVIMAFIGSAIAIKIFKEFETVPFTNRSRFICWSHSLEKLFGAMAFEQAKELLFKGKILPATHPQSMRVRLIVENIINGLHRGKEEEEEKEVWIDVAYASDIPEPITNTTLRVSDMLMMSASFGDVFSASGGSKIKSQWGNSAIYNYKTSSAGSCDPMEIQMNLPFFSAKDNEDNEAVVDVKWVQNCRKKSKWMKPTTKHLKAFDWEILLLKDCTDFTAFSFPAGKIVISAKFLENLRSDDEIAVILGHEVAHALARHIAEKMTICVWVGLFEKFGWLFGLGAQDLNKYLLSFSRNLEAEADYIGLLLMASAGYDPRVAPGVYKKLNKIHGGDSQLEEFECRFDAPSGEKRARLLAEPKIMDEALLMYHEATAEVGD